MKTQLPLEMREELEAVWDLLESRSPHYFPPKASYEPMEGPTLKERVVEGSRDLHIFTLDAEFLIVSHYYESYTIYRYVRKGYEGQVPVFPLSVSVDVGDLASTLMGEIRASEARAGYVGRLQRKIQSEIDSLNRIASRPFVDRGSVRDRWVFG